MLLVLHVGKTNKELTKNGSNERNRRFIELYI